MTTYVSPEQKHAENALQIAQSTVDSLKVSFASTFGIIHCFFNLCESL